MNRFTALMATGMTLAAAGCAGDDDAAGEQATAQSRPAPRLVATTAVQGGSAEERELLRGVADGMDETTLTRITIVPSESRREVDGEKAVGISFATVEGSTERRQWDQWIIAGAFSRSLLAADLPALVDVTDARGAFTARPTVEGNPNPGPLAVEREAAVVDGVRDAANASGAAVARLQVHRPYGLAIALSLAPAVPATYLRTGFRPLLAALDSYRPELEGVYVAVLDGRDGVVLEWGSWTRNPAGTYWVRRDLADCSPIRQSDPPGTEPPPPCPAA